MGRAIPVQVVYTGDVDGDLDVDLSDAILSLRILAGLPLNQSVGGDGDVNGDSKIGLAEAIYIMRNVAGSVMNELPDA